MGIKNPIFCDIGVTENCIFKCKMCKFWQGPRSSSELTIDEWKNFIASLAEFNSDNIRLHFGGGEPLLKDGILELIEFANKRGFTTVMVTNGFLIDETMAERIVRSGLDVISISLDSLDANVHDFLRGQKGAHQQAMQAIGYLNKYRAKSISILALIAGYNLNSLIDLTDWINQESALSSVYFQAISQPIAAPKDSEWYKRDESSYLWPQDEKHLNRIIGQLIDYKRKGYKISNSIGQLEIFKSYFKEPNRFRNDMKCNQGDYIIYVRPTGEIMLCGLMAPIGNVRNDNIKDIWYSEKAESKRQQIYNCKESCLNVINCFVDKELP